MPSYAQCPIPTGFIEWGGYEVLQGPLPKRGESFRTQDRTKVITFILQDDSHMFNHLGYR
jgi:hypothetical protein